MLDQPSGPARSRTAASSGLSIRAVRVKRHPRPFSQTSQSCSSPSLRVSERRLLQSDRARPPHRSSPAPFLRRPRIALSWVRRLTESFPRPSNRVPKTVYVSPRWIFIGVQKWPASPQARFNAARRLNSKRQFKNLVFLAGANLGLHESRNDGDAKPFGEIRIQTMLEINGIHENSSTMNYSILSWVPSLNRNKATETASFLSSVKCMNTGITRPSYAEIPV